MPPKKIPKTVVAFKFPVDKENDRAFSRYYGLRENLQALAVRWQIPCTRCRRLPLESKISAETEYWVILIHPKSKVGDLVAWLDEKEVEEVRISLNVPTFLRNANIECAECCNQNKQFGMPQCSQSEVEESYNDKYQSTSNHYSVERKPLPLSIKKENMDIPSDFSRAINKEKVPQSLLPLTHSSPTQINISQKRAIPSTTVVIPPKNFDDSEGFNFLTASDFITFVETASMDRIDNFVENTDKQNISQQAKTKEFINTTQKNILTKQKPVDNGLTPQKMTKEEAALFNKVVSEIEQDAINKGVSTKNLRSRPVPPPFPKRKLSTEESSPSQKRNRPTPPPFPRKKNAVTLRNL